jgi:hypothetical protein
MNRGRAGELDRNRWALGRHAPQLTSANGAALAIGPSTMAPCRPDLPAQVWPGEDTWVCEPLATLKSHHMMTVVGVQNYGQNSYRIRQPFDFGGRTGRIVFDAQGYVVNRLLGWISVEVTEDPLDAPSFAIGDPGTTNDEGSMVPRNGVEVQFQVRCGFEQAPGFGIRMIDVVTNYVDAPSLPASDSPCLSAGVDKLNHFEIELSQSRIDVYATPSSDDGVTFAERVHLHGAELNLPFSRGYVHITTHNHATLKYSDKDAWVARWDNVGFDGPIINDWRESEVKDALQMSEDGVNREGPVMNVGYTLRAAEPAETFVFENVDVSDVTSARMTFAAWFLNADALTRRFGFRLRLNGHAWLERPLTDGENFSLTDSHSQGQIGVVVDLDPQELRAGANTVEILAVNASTNYPSIIANIDLVMQTRERQ